jgi:DNA polymerase-1
MLWWVEHRGMMVCPNRLKKNRNRLQKIVDREQVALQKIAAPYLNGGTLNPGSPYELAWLLFDKMGMTPKPGLGRSTAKEVLEGLPQVPVVKAIGAWRKAQKALSTYVTSIAKAIEPTGRVYATYKIHGTRTGRLAAGLLLTIPRDKKIRGQFCAPEGRRLIKVDSNQAELRSLAHYSNDTFLCGIYNSPSGKSLHDETAAGEFGPNFTSEQKMIAKNINFGIVYGITAVGLQEQTKHSLVECERYIDRWFKRAPGAKKFIDRCRTAPLRGTNLITVFGRKKRHWIVTRGNLHHLMNEAANFPHQSSANDINLLTAIRARPLLQERDCWIVNIIHDEILVECPDDPVVIEWAKQLLCRLMEDIPIEYGMTRVPFVGEAEEGRRWGIYLKSPKTSKGESESSESERSADDKVAA